MSEQGVSKIDYDHFLYTINYKAIPKKDVVTNPKETSKEEETSKEGSYSDAQSKADKLRELKQLLDEGILTQEEYEKEKAKILSSELQ